MHEQDGMGRMPGRVLSWSTYQLHQSKEALRIGKETKEGPLSQPATHETGPSQVSHETGPSQVSAQPNCAKLVITYADLHGAIDCGNRF
jgi:hypothetical protein